MGRSSKTRIVGAAIILAILAAGLAYGSDGQEEGQSAVEAVFDTDLDFAQVVYVKATEVSPDVWRFDVTVRHNDQGWDHYADAWQVVDPQSGEILGERILAHPHDNEQPFTRSQSGIAVPQGLDRVRIRSKCNVHGFGGREILVDLSLDGGENYQVQHHR